MQVWSSEGAATQGRISAAVRWTATWIGPSLLRRLGTGEATTEATGAAGDRPRPPMQFLSLTLGGETLVGGSSVAKELQIVVRLRREPRDPDRVLARRM